MPQVLIPAGDFLMGSTPEQMQVGVKLYQGTKEPKDLERFTDEGPQRKIRLSAYWIDLHEVTVAQYRQFAAATKRPMPPQPEGSAPDHPVVNLSWPDAQAYATWAGRQLPSEAQWEKAARGGLEGRLYPWGDDFGRAAIGLANLYQTAHDPYTGTAPVGALVPNGFGLHHVAGNVVEWCRDWYETSWLEHMPAVDPLDSSPTAHRSVRGGGWGNVDPRIGNRGGYSPETRNVGIGFRCVSPVD